jgi:hypothetical protein
MPIFKRARGGEEALLEDVGPEGLGLQEDLAGVV